MKQKLGIVLFIAGCIAAWWLFFSNEGEELGADFVAWIEDIVKF